MDYPTPATECAKQQTHAESAVSRLLWLVSQADSIRSGMESKLGPILRTALPQPPNAIGSDPTPILPPLFADLNLQMDSLERQLEQIVALVERIEL